MGLYADYIERFYSSRLDDVGEQVWVDTGSVDSIANAVRHIFGSSLPEVYDVSEDTDLFSLGLDSLLVFRVIKAIRGATGLKDRLSPRHLYANPTIDKFSAAVAQLVADARKTNGTAKGVDDDVSKMKRLIDKYKARVSPKVNPFDLMNPNIYVGMNFYFPLREDVSFEQAFQILQAGLRRAIKLVPELEGKVMRCSEHEMGYKNGDLRITLPPLPSTATPGENRIDPSGPRQFKFRDLSRVLPSFEAMRAAGFVSSLFKDEVVLDAPWFPPLPADVLIAQANFVMGGCILATNFHHACVDGMGAITALRVWAESCRFVQGDAAADCSWLDPESLNRSLPHILYEQEGYARPAREVDPRVWGFLGFSNPAELESGVECELPTEQTFERAVNGNVAETPVLPPAPDFPRKFDWPPIPPADGRHMKSTTFLITPGNVEKLKQQVMADPEAKGAITSVNDIVQAFFWRAALKARYRVATELRGEVFSPDATSILELAIDARPYFSPCSRRPLWAAVS